MSTITFGGLASGLDTDSIIEALMEIESAPLENHGKTISVTMRQKPRPFLN